MEDRILLLFDGGRGDACSVFEAVLRGMPVGDAKVLLWGAFRRAALDAGLLSGGSLDDLASFLDQLMDRCVAEAAAGRGAMADGPAEGARDV
ncbi:hypothetical protein [Mucilaginibacter ginsenosidivorans]|uniref:Uncharacterized protein n=1 Tax=Mucilaginibacter ginsenosidivorans TaxID=398053 RepID=A0A5B8UTZ9_9SPHI|nr:hypothetical protein [Mucilaginibacter ginsenosidivorans]QEC62524.1 hypothetical protein FRZ54_07955 [Mucilaginibacter ginsenosidivorans]